jgi:hypothetical protein
MPFINIVCGGQGQGKTTFVKNSVSKMQGVIVLDVNNEYKDLEKEGAKLIIKDFRTSLENIKNLNGITLIVEEATVFFSNRKYDENLLELIIRKRHQKNNIFLIYHSLTDIPDYLLRLSDYLILFKTKDNSVKIDQKYNNTDIRKAFYIQRNQKEAHRPYILKLLK